MLSSFSSPAKHIFCFLTSYSSCLWKQPTHLSAPLSSFWQHGNADLHLSLSDHSMSTSRGTRAGIKTKHTYAFLSVSLSIIFLPNVNALSVHCRNVQYMEKHKKKISPVILPQKYNDILVNSLPVFALCRHTHLLEFVFSIIFYILFSYLLFCLHAFQVPASRWLFLY